MSKNFNTGQYNLGNNSATEALLARFEGSMVSFVSRGGITTSRLYGSPGRAILPHHQRLCSIREMSSGTGEPQNEREAREAGKLTSTINDGVEFSWTITVKGDDVYTLAALQGNNMHNLTANTIDTRAGIRYGGTFVDAGDLIITSFDKGGSEGKVIGSRVIPDCTVKFEEVPGISDPETDVTVTITSKAAPYHFGSGIVAVPFLFYDNGIITNTNAPNGILTQFAIKNANEAYGPNAAPAGNLLLQQVDADQSGIGKYVIGLRVDGAKVTTGVTVAQGTGTLTWATAPADGAKIMGIVAVPSGLPDYSASYTYSTGSPVLGSDGNTYVANTSTTNAPPHADWDAVPIIDPPYWGTSPGGEEGMYDATHPCYPGLSWLGFNKLFG